MLMTHDSCVKASENLDTAVHSDWRFPAYVFRADWSDFFFFDSDWIFNVDFVQHVKTLLDVENGTCACLSNLDAPKGVERQDSRFFIDRQTPPDAYRSLLIGAGPGSGWIYDMDRYACISDVSDWCIYCERASEIAIIALRSAISVQAYLPTIEKFKAARIDEAIKRPGPYGFSDRALSAQWRNELSVRYAGSRHE
jgi:hypothetical protein